MSFLGKLFGKKPPLSPLIPSEPTATPSDPSKDPNMIRVHDAYGQERFFSKETWRKDILPDVLKKECRNPDTLSATIIQSLHDGFTADVLGAAQQLHRIDADAERATTILANVYLQTKRIDEAEAVISAFVQQHGETGSIVTNLAKVHSARGEVTRAESTLWHALELDPNQDNGLLWFAAIARDRSGEPGWVDAIRRTAALPRSWRAHLWLARDALTRRQLDEALALYNKALTLVPRPVPTDFLQQLSGDLGNHGHLPEILRLVEPLYQLELHGIAVGNNLLKANLDLGRIDAARVLLDELYAQKQMDWKESLSFWDTEIAKARTAVINPPPDGTLSVSMLVGEGPIWLPHESPASELFPPVLSSPVRVAFLGSSAETPGPGDKPVHQMSDRPGRMSRALPLFFAEYVRLDGDADVRTIVPWLQGDTPAFVLRGARWEDADAAQHARTGETPSDYLVLTHLNAKVDPWTVDLRLIRTIDARCLGTAQVAFPSTQPENAVRQAADDLVRLLSQHAEFTPASPPLNYVTPTGTDFAYYLLRLEQLLAVCCSGMDNVPVAFLSGTREIIDGNLQLCLNEPTTTVVRLLLVQTLQRMKKAYPQVIEEYRDKICLLQKEKPLPATAQAVVERLLTEVYT